MREEAQLTQHAAKVLGDSGVIEPWPLQIERGDGQEPLKVQGLHRINEKALNELSAEAFASLRSHGALALAYGQLFSMNQLSQLTERAKFHAQQQSGKAADENLDAFFDGDDEELTFDFGE
ncbi:SapC family protein [Modicisalibacter sp. 'Wilcox']|uniref:SapC family protein n=1 Tax=Modicisalibacter sp. 'Wilcox' TaxID=2679914 RepID=UPI0013CFBCFB|nr:SapC family protein [Modicisalibacter sp. 'Wilcox']